MKHFRKEKGLSQDAIAQQLFISRQAVSRWESGEATPDMTNLVQLAKFLAVDLDELVLGKRPTTDNVREPATSTSVKMNGWEFLTHYWWLIFAIGGWLTWFIPAITRTFH
ncbi:helix-turn-helix domain-containing protein [Loigolactobacillus zhaoyuanensis]|uniref:helix-turn-helix domain-containing protein n=1 Tax=Loigolactobacillus zhaoyuanensis TaxID=2486017 RepID=UPI000F73C7A4|nr:helix-turn-helix transcriptional regulator [Loigolactobacillus zhaoyuanensis]